jgi:uncharacterized protein YlxP (DUF503 family)
MVIGLVTARISIPGATSLKDKRSVVRSLKDRIVNRMNVSVAETDHHDQHRLAELAFVTVAAEQAIVQKRISEISRFLEHNPRFVLLDLSTEFL